MYCNRRTTIGSRSFTNLAAAARSLLVVFLGRWRFSDRAAGPNMSAKDSADRGAVGPNLSSKDSPDRLRSFQGPVAVFPDRRRSCMSLAKALGPAAPGA